IKDGAVPSGHTNHREEDMRISDFCFIVAGLSALAGMCLGISMGISQDFTLSPAHAHLNLLGWVSMAVFGLYHRGTGRTGGALGWTQVGAGAVGAVLMSGGLAAYLSNHDDTFMPLVVAGSLAALAGMLLFVAIVVIDVWASRSHHPSAS
ncbi:MAG: hypothetical protein B7Y02_13870, partial [Rhodobacterales bacterium 17-64-5]